MGLYYYIMFYFFIFNINVLILRFLTIFPSRMSPFNHIDTLLLQQKHSQLGSTIFCKLRLISIILRLIDCSWEKIKNI